jgi:hypothetical protein
MLTTAGARPAVAAARLNAIAANALIIALLYAMSLAQFLLGAETLYIVWFKAVLRAWARDMTH